MLTYLRDETEVNEIDIQSDINLYVELALSENIKFDNLSFITHLPCVLQLIDQFSIISIKMKIKRVFKVKFTH